MVFLIYKPYCQSYFISFFLDNIKKVLTFGVIFPIREGGIFFACLQKNE